MSDDTLTPTEVQLITERAKPAAQAAVLARRGVPYTFTGDRVLLQRAAAMLHHLLPDAAGRTRATVARSCRATPVKHTG